MMNNRFFKFIRVYWKGILLYALGAALVSFLIVFMYYGGTSFFGMEGFYRKNMMVQMGIYMLVFFISGRYRSSSFRLYIYMIYDGGGGMSKMLSKDSWRLPKRILNGIRHRHGKRQKGRLGDRSIHQRRQQGQPAAAP